MNARRDSFNEYIAQQGLAEGARNKTAPTVVHVAPIQRKAIPAWLWLLTLVPWLVVGVECIA